MPETELKVILKAKDLAEHTLRVTSNCNRYPKKYRFSLVDKMQNKALEIYEYLYEANRTDLKNASGISFNVLAKMGKNEFVSMESLHKICLTLK